MERLTYRPKEPYISRSSGDLIEAYSDADIRDIINRLAAYEDTGLTPEEVNKVRADTEAGYMRSIARAYGIDVDRLRELVKADKEGRVVMLPCKVGDTVYLLFAGNPNNPVISTLKINTVSDAVNLIGKMGMRKYIGRFLSREEAEKALEAMKDGNA